MTVELENWQMVESSDSASTAQGVSLRLRGKVYGHPDCIEGSKITTSPIERVDGKLIYCKNRVYSLGKPAQEYLDSIKTFGVEFDPENPLDPYNALLQP
jgi:hypothetical protein